MSPAGKEGLWSRARCRGMFGQCMCVGIRACDRSVFVDSSCILNSSPPVCEKQQIPFVFVNSQSAAGKPRAVCWRTLPKPPNQSIRIVGRAKVDTDNEAGIDCLEGGRGGDGRRFEGQVPFHASVLLPARSYVWSSSRPSPLFLYVACESPVRSWRLMTGLRPLVRGLKLSRSFDWVG
jgi:hypothetical protein